MIKIENLRDSMKFKENASIIFYDYDVIWRHIKQLKFGDVIKGGKSSCQFQWFTIAKIEL